MKYDYCLCNVPALEVELGSVMKYLEKAVVNAVLVKL